MKAGASVRLRADGRWEARYIKGRNPDKSIIYGYVYAGSREEVELKRGNVIEELIRTGKASEDIMQSAATALNMSATSGLRFKSKKYPEPLCEEVALAIEKELQTNENGFPFLCSIYMGVGIDELCALRYSDFEANVLTVSHVMLKGKTSKGIVVPCAVRKIPVPAFFESVVENAKEKNGDSFVMTNNDMPIDGIVKATNIFRKISQKAFDGKTDVRSLRSTFISRALRASLNLETVSELTGLTKEQLKKYYGHYIIADTNKINSIYNTYDVEKRTSEMNLLILGAGTHGHGVKETAQRLGVFQRIAFLDDVQKTPEIVGKCSDYEKFIGEYPAAFVAIGDNEFRSHYVAKLKEAGFLLPKFIHPDAIVSPNAKIGEGTIVMAQATVNADAEIGFGCILATGAIVDYGAKVGDYAHIDSAAMVTRDAEVQPLETVESGEIVKKKKIS